MDTIEMKFRSGTKLFTGLAACKLIDEGKLSLDDRIWDVVPMDLGAIDRRVTVRHLLTHTSGIGDYIDEEAPGSFDAIIALTRKYPVYLWNNLAYYLPMFNALPAKFEPGTRFGYANAGFVLLGLAIESAGGQAYQEYVTEHIIAPCGLAHTGFYRMDKLWRALFAGKILSPRMLERFLAPYVARDEEGGHYGLGVYMNRVGEQTVYFAVGGDFGVDFFTAYFPREGIVASALGNTGMNTWPLFEGLL